MSSPRTLTEIKQWIAARVGREVGVPAEEIDPNRSFDTYGLDSLNAAMIAGELEDWSGSALSATLLFECPTVDTLAAYLAGVIGQTSSAAGLSGGRESGLLGIVLGGERMPLKERLAKFSAFRDTLPPEAYLRVLDASDGAAVTVLDTVTGAPREMIMFGSNNYLGLANHPHVIERVAAAVRRFGIGLAGPPVLNGYSKLHRELEERLSAFKHCEDTLIFPTGYAANVGLMTSLPVRGDLIAFDEYIHASIYDGLRMGTAKLASFPHNDAAALDATLGERATGQDAFVVVEGVYSMDGDLAPLDAIVPICERRNALLVLDDAHATGVVGPGGRGSASHFGVEDRVHAQVGTFSKAFGAVGGFVSASKPIIDHLRFLARPYVFSATLPPAIVAGVLAGLDVMEREPQHLEQLRANVAYAQQQLAAIGVEVTPQAAILAIHAAPGMNVRSAARHFHESGIFLNAVEYPAVPRDKERFRVGLSSVHTREHIDRLVGAVAELWSAHGAAR